MERIAFKLSGLLSLVGIVLLSINLTIHELTPKLGRMAFQIGHGSYSPIDYEPGTPLQISYALSVTCILVGSIGALHFWRPRE